MSLFQHLLKKKNRAGVVSVQHPSQQDRALAACRHGIPICAQAGGVKTQRGERGGEDRAGLSQSVVC